MQLKKYHRKRNPQANRQSSDFNQENNLLGRTQPARAKSPYKPSGVRTKAETLSKPIGKTQAMTKAKELLADLLD